MRHVAPFCTLALQSLTVFVRAAAKDGDKEPDKVIIMLGICALAFPWCPRGDLSRCCSYCRRVQAAAHHFGGEDGQALGRQVAQSALSADLIACVALRAGKQIGEVNFAYSPDVRYAT